jgi:hypothetical protein
VLRYRLAAICARAHTHTRTHTQTHANTHTHTHTHTHTPCCTAAQETLLQRQQEIAAERAKAGLTADGRPLSSQSIGKTRVASAGTEHVSLPDDVRGMTVSGTTPYSTGTINTTCPHTTTTTIVTLPIDIPPPDFATRVSLCFAAARVDSPPPFFTRVSLC